MLICVDCQRTNAPWAKKCTACGADLHAISPSTLIAGYPEDALDRQKPAEPTCSKAEISADIRDWNPDTEWHSLDEIDGEKVLDRETIEPISVIEPSRTAEIDWGNSRDDTEKFDSTPIQADSKNRFDEYGYDFERAHKSAWKTTAILLSGIIGILTAGGLAIGYLHSTTIPALPKSIDANAEKNGKANPRAASVTATAGMQGNPAIEPVMTEEVISVTKPMGPVVSQVNTEKQNTPLIKGASTQQEMPSTGKAAVFVMSASEPILAKPEAGKIAASAKKADPIPTIIQKQAALPTPAKPYKPNAVKPDAKTPPYPLLVPVPSRSNDGRPSSGDLASSTQNEPTSTSATAATQIAVAQSPTRLKDRQSNECSNSAFLGKVLCEERSRVNFCSNRWNAHPDCQLNNNKLEP